MAFRKVILGATAMESALQQLIAAYNDQDTLDHASTIPAAWYVDEHIARLERQNVFGGSWQVVARGSQLREPGDFITTDLAGEPIVVVRGADHQLRAFFNV
jgi:choline monooxygenase